MTDFRMQSPLGPRVVIAGRERDYFSGTGYLGLHNHPQVKQAAVDAILTYGLATGTSRGGYGEHEIYDSLEASARAFFSDDPAARVLYYPSGYFSTTILAQGLGKRCERIFIDAGSHYSVWDGVHSTGKPVMPFRHLDPQALAEQLKKELRPGERPFVFSDGVFPISGEVAPVAAYRDVLQAYDGAWLALDDAHATGVLGENGRGTFEAAGLLCEREQSGVGMIAGYTLSKGIGGYGGLICAPAGLMAEIEANSRVAVGASPPPLPVAAASRQALELAKDPAMRTRLWANVARARAGLRELGWPLAESPVPILCLGKREGVDLGELKDALFERGICVAHVKSYSSTPLGGALRIAIFANHSEDQIERLLSAMKLLAA